MPRSKKSRGNATPRPYRELPNSQVVDAAEQFHAAFRLLMDAGPAAGVLLPALHCASIALELYLKSLTARELELSTPIIPEVAIIYAQAPALSHQLVALFEQVPMAEQQILELHKAKRLRLNEYPSIRDVLFVHEPMFMTSRYPFEEGRDFDNIRIDVLSELLDTLRAGIHAVPHRWVHDPEVAK